MMTDDTTATPAASISEDAQQQLVAELVTRAHAEGGSLVGPDGLLAGGDQAGAGDRLGGRDV